MEQAKFTYSPLGVTFKTEIETLDNQGKKQAQASQSLKSLNPNQQLKSIKDLFPNIF